MNPHSIRSAIVTGLTGRSGWDDVDLFRYPAGDRGERGSGFELGPLEGAEQGDLDQAGESHTVTYSIVGDMWVNGDGAEDTDFATIESAVLVLLRDFQAWIVENRHGKALGITTLDYMDVASWELNFTPGPDAILAFTLEVSEYT